MATAASAAESSTPPLYSTLPKGGPVRTEQSPDNAVADVTFSDLDFSSSDDEAGVFFGTPKAIERKIVASLSKTIPPSPASRDLALTAASESRRTSLAKRVKKRDSREFIRRKTLLLSHPEVSPAEKVWEGNFYEKDPPEAEGAAETPTFPEEQDEAVPHIFDMTTSLITEGAANMSSSSSSSSLNLDIFNQDESLESDFDKENTDVPEPYDYTPEPEYVPDEPEDSTAAIALGMREVQLIDLDQSLHLDLGGLNILDVDDPEVCHEVGQMTSTVDLLGSSESESGDSSFRSTVSTLSEEAVVESLMEPLQSSDPAGEPGELETATEDEASSVETSPAKTPVGALGLQISEEYLATPLKALSGLEVEDLRVSAAKPAPRELARVSDASFAESDLSFASDMNSPKARGPVKIPVFSVPSPRNTPVRGLAPSSQDDFTVPESSDAFALPSIDSPAPSPRPTPGPTAPVLISTFTPEVRQKVFETLPPSQRPTRILKSSHIRTSSKSENRPPDEMESKIKERAQVIRGELDNIFKAKCAGFGLPRPPNGSNAPIDTCTVSATPRRAAPKPVKDQVESTKPSSTPRRAATKPVNEVAEPKKPLPTPRRAATSQLAEPTKAFSPNQKTVKKAMTTASSLPRPTSSIPTARKRLEPSSSRPTASTAAKTAPPHRPPLTASKRTVAAPSRTSVSVSAIGRSVVVPLRPAETPVKMKQRAFEQPVSARARPMAVGVGGPRPTLGPAARLVRDPSSGDMVYATTGGQSFSADFAPMAPPRSPVAQFTPRSPAAHYPPRSPGLSLGRARRPGLGAAPTPQRMSRIAGGLGGATRTGTLRQPSPIKSTVVPQLLVQGTSDESSSSGGEGLDSGAKDDPQGEPKHVQSQAESQSSEKVQAEPSPEPTNAPAPSETEPTTQAEEASPEPAGGSPNGEPNGSSQEQEPSEPEPEKKRTPSPPPAPESSTPVSASGRPRRTPKPVERLVQAPVPQKAAVTPSIAPGLTEKELKTQTQRNTMRNQVYFCAFDRQIVRIPGPRPPSPTSGIRTLAEKDEEEQKADRDARARRRRASGSDTEDEAPPIIEKVHVDKAPGDEEDVPWKTPLRKRKRVVVSSDDEDAYDDSKAERNVRWDRALTVFRGGLGETTGRARRRSTGENGHDSLDTRRTHSEEPSRSSLKQGSQIQLDKSGNAVDRPVEKLKRQKITVTAVFYDGEEPVPEPAKNTRSKKKKNT